MYPHTQQYTIMHTCTHAVTPQPHPQCTQSHIHTFTHSHIHTFTHSHSHTFTHSHSDTVTQSHSHTATQSHSHTVTHDVVYTQAMSFATHSPQPHPLNFNVLATPPDTPQSSTNTVTPHQHPIHSPISHKLHPQSQPQLHP